MIKHIMVLKSSRILFIEDDLNLRKIIGPQLQHDLGIEVTIASSGNEGIGLIKKNQFFLLIVSDFNMTDGTGLDVLNYLHLNQLKIPFFFYTSELDLNIENAYPFFKGTFHKFEYKNLVRAVSKLLGKCESG